MSGSYQHSNSAGVVYRQSTHPKEVRFPLRPAPDLQRETFLLEGGKVVLDKDIAVEMRDGVTLYADIYKPIEGIAKTTPTLVMWAPFGKHGAVNRELFPDMGVDFSRLSQYTHFELPDPLLWCGEYAYSIVNIDPRGTWWSEGSESNYLSPEEARDGYDLVEWIAKQPWSTGKIGWGAVSYYAMSAYHVAALQPPHLAAIMPWEGISDLYREVNTVGGIPSLPFQHMWMNLTGNGLGRCEDHAVASLEHPLYDEWWKQRVADWTQITVPAFSVVGFSSLALHLRGTIEAWKQFASRKKYLLVHGGREWEQYYQPDNISKQKAFWDRFLKDEANEVDSWPAVQFDVRSSATVALRRADTVFPPSNATLTAFSITSPNQLVRGPSSTATPSESQSLSFQAHHPTSSLSFDCRVKTRVEVTGNAAAKLHIQAIHNPDVDVFVAVHKIDRSGQEVLFYNQTQQIEVPAALGWLRASHRELDRERSIPGRPYHTHAKRQWLRPCDIVPVEIEIWPSSTVWEEGEILRFTVKGTPFTDGENPTQPRIPSHSYGEVKLWVGGEFDTSLFLPLVEGI